MSGDTVYLFKPSEQLLQAEIQTNHIQSFGDLAPPYILSVIQFERR